MSEQGLLPPRYAEPQPIARGGMGEVYRAQDRTLGRDVAIKVLAERRAADEEVRARFTREALAAARLSGQPNTVTIFDVGEWNGRPFMVMERLAGGSLAERLHGQPVAPGRALEWLEQAARALDAAHEKGVVHRDVKPANLLLNGEGVVHVADFGIASATGLDSLTHTGTVLGTAGYLSPEQAAGTRATPASDRYALAVVAFELLTGTRPFAAESPPAEAFGHAQGEIPAATERNPELAPEVDDVFRRALAKQPEDRYPSCAEFVGDLRHALASTAGPTERLVATLPAAARPHVPVLPLVLAALAALALGGIALAAMLLGDGENQAAPPPSTLVTTVVTTAPVTAEPTPPPPPPPQPTAGTNGRALTDQAAALLRDGRFEEALPLAAQAYSLLQGGGELYEAYAAYNYAWALAGTGSCSQALPLLAASEQIQGPREEIKQLRKQCRKGGESEGD